MNTLDIILLVPLLWGLVRGFMKGFILQLAGIAAYLLAIIGATHLSGMAANLGNSVFGWHSGHAKLIAFAVLFVIIVVLVFLLARMMEKAVKATGLSVVNKISGSLLGCVKFFLIFGSLLYFTNAAEGYINIIPSEYTNGSVLYPYFLKGIKLLLPTLKALI